MSKVRAEMCFVFKDSCYCKKGDYSKILHGVMKCENSIKPPPRLAAHLLPPEHGGGASAAAMQSSAGMQRHTRLKFMHLVDLISSERSCRTHCAPSLTDGQLFCRSVSFLFWIIYCSLRCSSKLKMSGLNDLNPVMYQATWNHSW